MILLIIAGMSLATMIPRFVPAFIVEKLEFRPWINRWLNAIPFAALGALIFPGVLLVKEDEPFTGLIGGVVAVVLAYLKVHITLVVFGAIGVVYLLSL